MKETWAFQEGDRILFTLTIKEDKCMSAVFADDFPYEREIIKHLCMGLVEDLVDHNVSFNKLKKYYINDFHFERAE